jgi:hypothetical protein
MFVLKTIAPTVPAALTFVTRVSIVTLLKASSAARADAWMFDAAAEGEIQKPSTNEPFELSLVLIVTSVGKKDGVMSSVVPTNASAATANV